MGTLVQATETIAMPIKVELGIQSQLVNLPDIGPKDPPGSFTHLDPEEPCIVVVSCNPDDTGGFVYRGNPDTSQTILNNAVRLMTEEAEVEAVIEQCGSYERELITKFGLGVLILKHYK